MPRPPRIAIIGGGIGGLAAALALERRGAEAVVHEQSGALSEIGAGLNLTPNAVKALRALGLEQKVQAIAAETDFLNIRSWKSGRYISRTKRGDFRQKFGAPNLSVHRADLLDVLAAALKTTQLRFGARCVGVDGGARSATARFADGSTIEADVVVGADGIHSAVRESLFGADKPRFTGCICWRGMVPVEAVPADIDTKNGAMWMGPHGHVVHYPVRRGELLNIVAHVDSDAWTGRILDAAMRRGRSDDDLCGVESGADKTLSVQRALVQMGAVRPRPAGAMGRRPRHAARQFRPRHAALSRHRRRHGDRGRLCTRRIESRGRAKISALRFCTTSGCACRAPRRPCSAPAPAPRKIISPRPGRGSSAT